MAGKNKKQPKYNISSQNRVAQILFAIFAIMIILSMVLSAVISY